MRSAPRSRHSERIANATGRESLLVRMGVHTGAGEERDGDYYGTAVNRAARLMAVAHGGQVLTTRAVQELVGDEPGDSVELVGLGDHRLRDLAQPIEVFQVVAPGLAREFPALQSLDALPGNLPVQHSSFVGREREIAEVRRVGARRADRDADRRGWRGQDASGMPGGSGSPAGVPRRCMARGVSPDTRPELGRRRGRRGVRGAATPGHANLGHAGRSFVAEAAAAGARQLRAPARQRRRAGARTRGSLPRAVVLSTSREGLGIARRTHRGGAIAGVATLGRPERRVEQRRRRGCWSNERWRSDPTSK